METAAPFKSSQEITNLVAALAKAQGEFPRITKDKEVVVTTRSGSRYSFSYAPLETIMEAVRPVLAQNGLAIVQMVDDKTVSTLLMHTTGQWLLSLPLPIRISEDASNSSQALGSAITYAKRYSICAMLGIVADDDDDGNAAEGNDAKTTRDNTPHGLVNAATKAMTGKTVAANLREAKEENSFLKSLRVAAPLGSAELKKIWNGGSKEDRLAIQVQEWEAIKLIAANADNQEGASK